MRSKGEQTLNRPLGLWTLLLGAWLALGAFAGVAAAEKITDDFSADSGLWNFLGRAAVHNDGTLELTPSEYGVSGTLWLKQNQPAPFAADFRFRISDKDDAGGGISGSGADGFIFMFNKQRNVVPITGGGMGFETGNGYGVEFDTFKNDWDAAANHVALIKNGPQHNVDGALQLGYASQSNLQNGSWHTARVEVASDLVRVFVDGQHKFTYRGALDDSYSGVGFTASTGWAYERHQLDDVTIDTAPFVTSVGTSWSQAGAGDALPIQVAFSRPVTVSGTPQLSLNNGRTAVYSAGSGTDTLTFAYVVQPGDTLTGLNYSAVSALLLSGGTMLGADGDAALLSLPPLAASESLGGSSVAYAPTDHLAFANGAALSTTEGASVPLAVYAVRASGAVATVTAHAAFSSSQPDVAAVSAEGVVTALQSGEATITAAFDGKQASLSVQVAAAPGGFTGLLFGQPVYALTAGDSVATVVYGVYGDGSRIPIASGTTYAVSDASVATVGADGRLYAAGVGQTVVAATYGQLTASATVTVAEAQPVLIALMLQPEGGLTLQPGDRYALTAMAHYADGAAVPVTPLAAYASSAPAMVAVSATGVVTALQPGEATITASFGGLQATRRVVVVPTPQAAPVGLRLASPVVAMQTGESRTAVLKAVYANGAELTATGGAVWTTSNAQVVAIEGEALRAAGPGTAVVTASFGGVTQPVAEIRVVDRMTIDAIFRGIQDRIDANGDQVFDAADVSYWLRSIPPIVVSKGG